MSTNLDEVDDGMRFRLDTVPDDNLRARLLRLGFLDGPVTCRHRIHNGPVVISRDGTELAVGQSVAAQISVTGVVPA